MNRHADLAVAVLVFRLCLDDHRHVLPVFFNQIQPPRRLALDADLQRPLAGLRVPALDEPQGDVVLGRRTGRDTEPERSAEADQDVPETRGTVRGRTRPVALVRERQLRFHAQPAGRRFTRGRQRLAGPRETAEHPLRAARVQQPRAGRVQPERLGRADVQLQMARRGGVAGRGHIQRQEVDPSGRSLLDRTGRGRSGPGFLPQRKPADLLLGHYQRRPGIEQPLLQRAAFAIRHQFREHTRPEAPLAVVVLPRSALAIVPIQAAVAADDRLVGIVRQAEAGLPAARRVTEVQHLRLQPVGRAALRKGFYLEGRHAVRIRRGAFAPGETHINPHNTTASRQTLWTLVSTSFSRPCYLPAAHAQSLRTRAGLQHYLDWRAKSNSFAPGRHSTISWDVFGSP